MSSQDQEMITDVLSRVKSTGNPERIELSRVGEKIFRNIYLEAKNLNQGILDIQIIEKGKVYEVVRVSKNF